MSEPREAERPSFIVAPGSKPKACDSCNKEAKESQKEEKPKEAKQAK